MNEYTYFLKKYININFTESASPIASLQTLIAPKAAATTPISNTFRMQTFCLKITIYNIDIHQTSQQLCGYNMRRHWFMSRRWFQIFSPSFIPNWFPLRYSVKHDMRLGFLHGFLHGLLHGLLHHSRHFLWHERFMNGSQC